MEKQNENIMHWKRNEKAKKNKTTETVIYKENAYYIIANGRKNNLIKNKICRKQKNMGKKIRKI